VQVDSSPARLAAQLASPRRSPRPQHGTPNHFSWLYEEAVGHYSAVALLYDLCAEDGQRRFGKELHAGFPRNFEYRWVEDGSSQAQSVSSPEYVREVLHWTEKVLGDPELEAGSFPRRFVSLMSTIFTRLFRVYAIMLHQHAEVLENQGALVHLRLAFEGFMAFALENDLVREKEFRVLQPEVDAVLSEFERGEAQNTLPSRPYSSSQTTLWNEQVTEEATLSQRRLPVAATSFSAAAALIMASPPRRAGSVQRIRGAPSAPAEAPPSAEAPPLAAPLSPLSSGSSQNAEPAPSPPRTAGAGKASFRKSVSLNALRLRSALLDSLSPSKLLRRGRGHNTADAATSQASPGSHGSEAGFAASAADASYAGSVYSVKSGSSSSLLGLRSSASLESFASLTSASSGSSSPTSALSPPSLRSGGSGGSAFFETGRSRSGGSRTRGVHFTAEEQVQRMSHLETLPAGLPIVEVEQMLTRVIESARSKQARACVVAVRNMIQAEIRFGDLVLKLHDEYVVPARTQARLPEATLDDMFGNVSEVRRLSEHICSEMHRAMQPLLAQDTAMRSMAFANGAALARVPTEVSPAMVVRAVCERGVLPNLGLFQLVYARNVAFYSEALEHINNAVARNNAFARIVQSKNAKLNTSLPALLEAVRDRPFEFAAQLAELSAAVYQAFHRAPILPQFPKLARLRLKQQLARLRPKQQQQQQQQQVEAAAQARGLTLTLSASSASSGVSSASDTSGEAESPESPSSQGARRGARREKREKRALRRLVVQTADAALAKARAVSDAAQLLRDEVALQALRPGKPALAAGVAAVKSAREGAAGLTDRWANGVVVVFEDCIVLAARPPSPKAAPGRALKRLTSSASMSSVLSASADEASPTNTRSRQQHLSASGLSRLRFTGLAYHKPAALAAGVAALMEEGVVMDGGLESDLVVEDVISRPVISDRRAAQALAAKGRVSLSFKGVDKAGAPRTVQLAGATLDLAAAIFGIAGQASLPAGLRSELLRQGTEDSRISNAFYGFAKPKQRRQQQQQQQEQQQLLQQQKPAPRRTVDVVVTRGAGHAAATLAMHAYLDCHKRTLRAWMPEVALADPAAAAQDAALAMHECRYLVVVLAPGQLERQLRHPALSADLAAAGKAAKPVVLLALDRDSPSYEDHDIDRAILTLPEPARAALKRAVRARYPVLPHAQAGLWAQLEADLAAARDVPVSPTELSSAGSGARQRRPRLSADALTRAPVDAVAV
jgi:MOB kinase activator 1